MPKRKTTYLGRNSKASRDSQEKREEESEEERYLRQAREQQRQHDRRQNEDEAQIEQRQALARQRQHDRRHREDEAQTEQRQANERHRRQDRRQDEDDEHTQQRRALERQRQHDRRQDEDEAQTEQRQTLDRHRQHDRRQDEDDEDRTQRQEIDRQRHVQHIQNENEDDRQQRLRQHRQRYQTRLPATYRIARQPIPLYVQRFSAGNMTVPCPHCGSLSFYKERFNCCHNGKVNLGIYPFPSQLETLFTQDTERGKNFRKNIRRYNTAFSFSSFSANLQSLPGRGPRVFRMCGQIYHNYATLYPANNALPPCFNQCYIYQQSEANEFRFLNPVTGGCTPDIFEIISEVLKQVNPYAHWYKTMAGRTQ